MSAAVASLAVFFAGVSLSSRIKQELERRRIGDGTQGENSHFVQPIDNW
jgi:hypothetical protein